MKLCEAQNDAKANSYGFGIGRARSLKGKTGTLKEKLHKVFNFNGRNSGESSKLPNEPSSEANTDDEFTPLPAYPRKRKSKCSESAVVSGKGKGSASKPVKRKVKEHKFKVVALPKATCSIPPRCQREKYTKDVWVRVTALQEEVERKIQETFGWKASEVPQYMYAQGKNLRVASLTDVVGAESWDFESVRALVGGGSLYIVKQVSCVSSSDSDSISIQSINSAAVQAQVCSHFYSFYSVKFVVQTVACRLSSQVNVKTAVDCCYIH